MKYPVFAQALALTIVVFVIGLYVGVVMEGNRMEKVDNYYLESEVSMMDILALNNLLDNPSISCDYLKEANFDLVDRVYEDAILLGDYEISGRITNNLETFHKKYDVLRTYLWIDAIKIREKCNNFNIVVYAYNNSNEDLTIKAKQNAWSRVLYDLKIEEKDNVLLISVDVGADLVSLNSILKDYKISNYPALIINGENVLGEISSVNEIQSYLK